MDSISSNAAEEVLATVPTSVPFDEETEESTGRDDEIVCIFSMILYDLAASCSTLYFCSIS